MTIRIIVADDQVLVRGAVAMMFDLEEDIETAAQVGNECRAIEAVVCGDIDVVLADVETPVMDRITAVSHIRKEHPNVRIFVVTTLGQSGYLRRAMEAGASGFAVKDMPSDSLASAVRRVMVGRRIIDSDFTAESLAASSNPLTECEQDVLRTTFDGRTTVDVSCLLFLSREAVRNYLFSAIRKAGVRTRTEAVAITRDDGRL